MNSFSASPRALLVRRTLLVSAFLLAAATALAQTQIAASPERSLLNQYCVSCHNVKLKTAGLTLDKLNVDRPGENPEVWEKVVRKVRAGMMPPSGARRPDRAALDGLASKIETGLDLAAAQAPLVSSTALHRLNRAEYGNAIRDMLAVEVDSSTLLPADDSSEGFDNIAAALKVSPGLMERYVSAAAKISRLAVGDPAVTAATSTYRIPGGTSQGGHIEGLPLGTRGGILFRHTFPLDADYTFKVNAQGRGLGATSSEFPDTVEVDLDGVRVKTFTMGGGPMTVQLPVKAGPRSVGVAIVKGDSPGADDLWKVIQGAAGLQSVAITGPLKSTGPGDTPSRRKVLTCAPASAGEEIPCAKRILSALATHAFRRPASAEDAEMLLGFYQSARDAGTFENGIQRALARILVDPRFLFRFEQEPDKLPAGSVYRVSDMELASRLSFFLWSSIPDDELINVASQGKLRDQAVLQKEVRRMLADPKSSALVTNFASQWLFLRDVKSAAPQTRDFNENLRQAMLRETELFVDSIIREDHDVRDLLTADYTFVDEQLAKHYGIPGIHGTRFRRVHLDGDTRRGLLGQGSILMVTSVTNRTSPVARGKFVLENLLGTPPPLPPPNVPALPDDGKVAVVTSVRQKMEEHRKNPVCASCHKIMDPIGFSLENFDLTGKWRATDNGTAIDASGVLVDGTKLDGPASLRESLLNRSDVFISTLTGKLLTYGMGRATRYSDMPSVRAIVRGAAAENYKFSSIILGIAKSAPFQMRRKGPASTLEAADAGHSR
jgi:cytochrome c551/c552